MDAKHYTMMDTLDPLQETSCPNVALVVFFEHAQFLLAIVYFLTCTVVKLAILLLLMIIIILVNLIIPHHPSTTSIISHPSSLIITIIVTTLVERGIAWNSYVGFPKSKTDHQSLWEFFRAIRHGRYMQVLNLESTRLFTSLVASFKSMLTYRRPECMSESKNCFYFHWEVSHLRVCVCAFLHRASCDSTCDSKSWRHLMQSYYQIQPEQCLLNTTVALLLLSDAKQIQTTSNNPPTFHQLCPTSSVTGVHPAACWAFAYAIGVLEQWVASAPYALSP